jgi:Uma2 family endonuclease
MLSSYAPATDMESRAKPRYDDKSSNPMVRGGTIPMSTVSLRVGLVDHGRTMTLEEFEEAEEEPGYRYELARGVLEVTHVPDELHGQIVCMFFNAIGQHKHSHPGMIYRYGGASEYRLWVPEMASGRNPDVAVTLRATPKDHRGRRPPALVIEVVSVGPEAHERDYITKREEYLVYGAHEYWIVDRQIRRVTVLIRHDGAWTESVFTGGEIAQGRVLPDFAVSLAGLWGAADEATGDDA